MLLRMREPEPPRCACQAYRKDVGLYFDSIHATWSHLLLAERLWYLRLTQESPAELARLSQYWQDSELRWEDFEPDKHKLGRLLLEQCFRWSNLVASMDDDALLAPMEYRNTSGQLFTAPMAGPLTQVFNHGARCPPGKPCTARSDNDAPACAAATHHRGQITAAFSMLGHTFPSLDLPAMGAHFSEFKGE